MSKALICKSSGRRRQRNTRSHGRIEYEPANEHRGRWTPMRMWRWRTVTPLGPWRLVFDDASAFKPHIPQ
jgi:hypothetical protein